jgi:hypothetical protein
MKMAHPMHCKLQHLCALCLWGMAALGFISSFVAAEPSERLEAERTALLAKPAELDEAGWASLKAAVANAAAQGKLVAADGTAGDEFGWSVALSGDTALVGATGDNLGANTSQGSAYVFVRSGNTWTQQQKLVASDGAAGDEFGFSVALSGDTALVGAPYSDTAGNRNLGTVYVFVRIANQWQQQQKLMAADGTAGSQFGAAVALSGETALVGAFGDFARQRGKGIGLLPQGSAYVFVRGGGTWIQQAKLTASDGAAGDFFGGSVALSGDTALVGATYDLVGANADQGSAYAFVRSGNTWIEQVKLVAADGAAGDQFGVSVALSGYTAVIGAWGDFVGAIRTGSAYVFVRSGSTWTQQAKLLAADGAASDQFGVSIALSGDTAVVGAYASDIGAGTNQGSAYLFGRSGSTWTQQAKMVASDGAANDQFGRSVALSGNTALLGARLDDIGVNPDQGSAYPFLLAAQSGSVTLTLPSVSLPRCPGVFSRFDYSWVSTGTLSGLGVCQAECANQACRDATTWAGSSTAASLPAEGSRSDRYLKPTPSSASGSVQLQMRCFTPTGGSVTGLATLSFRAGTGAECGTAPPPPANVAAAPQPDGSTQHTGTVANPGAVFLFAAISQQGQYGDAEAEMNGNTLVVRYRPRPEARSLSKGPVTETIRVLVGDGATAQEGEYSFQLLLPFVFGNGFA